MKITYRITFDKDGWMRYISHLDLMRVFSRALRRAGFKLYLSKGFSPHPVIRIKRALKLGIKGIDQEAEFVLEENMDKGVFGKRLSEELPEGIRIKDIEVLA